MLSWNKSNEGWISVCPALPVPTGTLRFFTVCTVQEEKKVEGFIRSRVVTFFLFGFGSFLLIFFLFRGWAYLLELRATASGLTEISMYILKRTRRKKKNLLFFCGILSFTELSEATVLDDGSMEENNSYGKSIS